MTDSCLRPILQLNENIINGTLSIQIVNLGDLYDNEADNELSIWYQSKFQNNEWKSKSFTIQSVTNEKTFFLKVPLCLLSYSLQYKLEYKIIKNDNISCMESITYTAEIPSILIDATFKKGDHVRFITNDTEYAKFGIIEALMEEDMIKIKDGDHMITVHSSKVMVDPIKVQFVIDITTKTKAVTDMILKTNDQHKIDVFCVISDVLTERYLINMAESECIADFMAVHIYEFLYFADYNYRIECVLGDSYLLQQEPWSDFLSKSWEEADYNKDPQIWRIKTKTSICDICRIEMNWFQYMFGCRCILNSELSDGHAFCISCIHSIMIQYNELKPFISELLTDLIDDNCIEEIVTFCVGKVIKYNDNKKENQDNTMDIDTEFNDCIDDNKPVGSKRSIKSNDINESRKRRRLN